jgi:hypothetical protein
LFAVIAFGTLSVLALTVLVPPWVKLKTQRREVLYYSERVKVYEQTFAGYDYLMAGAKWQRTGPANASSGTYFDADEYQVFWPLLVGEWVVLLLVGGGLFIVVSRRIRRSLESHEASADEESRQCTFPSPDTGDKKF